jgi:hypothetical protein
MACYDITGLTLHVVQKRDEDVSDFTSPNPPPRYPLSVSAASVVSIFTCR